MTVNPHGLSQLQLIDLVDGLQQKITALEQRLDRAQARLHAADGVARLLVGAIYPDGASRDTASDRAQQMGERLIETAIARRPRAKPSKVAP